jgi:hypothetical protein
MCEEIILRILKLPQKIMNKYFFSLSDVSPYIFTREPTTLRVSFEESEDKLLFKMVLYGYETERFHFKIMNQPERLDDSVVDINLLKVLFSKWLV